MTKSATEKPQKFAVRPGTVTAMQFTGKNGKALADWFNTVQRHPEIPQQIRNGGSWMHLVTEFSDRAHSARLTKGSVLVMYSSDGLHLFSALSVDEFNDNYRVLDSHGLICL